MAPIFHAFADMIRHRTLPTVRPHLAPHRGALLAGAVLLGAAGLTGCRIQPDEGSAAPGAETGAESVAAADSSLTVTLRQAIALADSVEDLLRPVPLMRRSDEEALRQYGNAENLEKARALGARPADSAELASLAEAGRLVRLEDSTRHWVVRELGASQPYVTPDTEVLLERLGAAFQERLAAMGLPPFRFEVSSVLRTAEDQAALRQRNVNATAGTSAHEYGTTVDIAYSGYAAPAELPEGLVAALAGSAGGERRAELEGVARAVLERMAARKSRELKAILGEVMREAQARGEVLVTLERLQPVYHITVAEALR